MLTKKFAFTLLVGAITVSIMGCSSTSNNQSINQFIEVHVQNKSRFINVNHIVSVHPGSPGASILMDTSVGALGGYIDVTESYEQLVQKLAK